MFDLKNTTKNLVEDLITLNPSYLEMDLHIFLEEDNLSSEQI